MRGRHWGPLIQSILKRNLERGRATFERANTDPTNTESEGYQNQNHPKP